MPVLICHDCDDPNYPGHAREWLYSCPECAAGFLRAHRATGHDMRSRPERTSDRYVFAKFLL